MNRWEFMRQLEVLLSDISPSEREEALQYYNDYFNDAGAENERQVIKALGSPAQVAKIVKDGLSDNPGMGEFTENGFTSQSGPTPNAIVKRNGPVPAQGQDITTPNSAVNGNAEYGSTGYGNAGSSAGRGSGSAINSNAINGSAINGSAINGSAEGRNGNAGRNNGNAGGRNGSAGRNNGNAEGKNGSAEKNIGNGEKNIGVGTASGAAGTPGAQSAGTGTGNGKKDDFPVWAIVLIVIGCIICSPAILGVAGAVLGVVASIFITALALVFGFGLVAFILFIVAVSLVAGGFGCVLSAPVTALGLVGGGLICLSLGIMFLLLTVFLAGKLIPAICQGIAYIFKKLFGKKEAVA